MEIIEPRSLISSGFSLIGQGVPNVPEDKNRLGCLLKVKIPGPPLCGPIAGGLEWGPGNL